MILGYETPVELPTMSVFDKDMMKMYLNALHEDYREGVEALKEFNKTFGNFYSPSSIDMLLWYENTQKPVLDYINQHPDAIRSREGRAELERLRNQVASNPLVNMIRGNVEPLKEYQKAYNEMVAKGEPMIPGTVDPSLWDSRKGAFSLKSPQKFISPSEYWKPIIDDVPKVSVPFVDPRTGMKGFQEGVSEDTANKLVDTYFPQWENSASGQAVMAESVKRQLAQNPNMDPEEAYATAVKEQKDAVKAKIITFDNPVFNPGYGRSGGGSSSRSSSSGSGEDYEDVPVIDPAKDFYDNSLGVLLNLGSVKEADEYSKNRESIDAVLTKQTNNVKNATSALDYINRCVKGSTINMHYDPDGIKYLFGLTPSDSSTESVTLGSGNSKNTPKWKGLYQYTEGIRNIVYSKGAIANNYRTTVSNKSKYKNISTSYANSTNKQLRESLEKSGSFDTTGRFVMYYGKSGHMNILAEIMWKEWDGEKLKKHFGYLDSGIHSMTTAGEIGPSRKNINISYERRSSSDSRASQVAKHNSVGSQTKRTLGQ